MSDVLLPPNATAGERALEQATARVGDVPVLARTMHNPDTIPAALLPWLAWAFSVDEWSPDWTEAQKRAAIKAAYDVQRHKGTIGAVRSALDALGLGMQIVEWFDDVPVADPYTFRVSVTADQTDLTLAALTKAIAVVESTKNLRSHLSEVTVDLHSQAGPRFAAAFGAGHEITILPG